MCGILGWASLDGSPLPEAELADSLPRLRHRGPDHQAAWSDGRCWLGHTRLSILDLSAAGHQPMSSPDGRYHIVYNGEFYDYRDHIPLLESKGYRLESSGDTAVLLGLYALFGPPALERVNGMFAVAIWDSVERRLFLGRDRLGKKPLYYAADGRRVCFASELSALAPLLGSLRLDGEALDAFFALGYVPAPLSVYSGIRKLEPATCVEFSREGARSRRYWSPSAAAAEPVTEEQVEGLLADAVSKRLVSDVPVGLFLSGGIDSSLIAALAGRPLRAYCMAGGAGFYDERPFAAEVARHCGLELRTSAVEADIPSLLDRVSAAMDEPLGDSSALPTFLVSEMAAREGKVVLSGEGGDELFGGYDKYLRFLAVRSFRWVPATIRRMLAAPAARLDAAPSWMRSAANLARHSLGDDVACFAAFNSQLARSSRRALYAPGFDESFGRDNAEYFQPFADSRLGGFSLQRVLEMDRGTYLPGDLLAKVDRMSMAHSLEVRCPFLDYRLVELARRLPEGELIDGGRTKVLLRRIAARRLPGSIAERAKKGFSVPVSRWFRGELAPLFRERVSAAAGVPSILDYGEIERRFTLHVEGRAEFGNHLWSILMFHLWWQRVSSKTGVSAP